MQRALDQFDLPQRQQRLHGGDAQVVLGMLPGEFEQFGVTIRHPEPLHQFDEIGTSAELIEQPLQCRPVPFVLSEVDALHTFQCLGDDQCPALRVGVIRLEGEPQQRLVLLRRLLEVERPDEPRNVSLRQRVVGQNFRQQLRRP